VMVAEVDDIISVTIDNPLGQRLGVKYHKLIIADIRAASISINVKPTSQFQLNVPAGIGLIHIPLKVTEVDGKTMEIQTVGALYDALGGANNVNLIITFDLLAGKWQSYSGAKSKGTSFDRVLADEMGIITMMKHPVTLNLKGEALGINGKSTIHLNRGINFVGVPLRDARLKRVSDLLSLEGIKDNATMIIVFDNGKFKAVDRADDDGDIALTGGQSVIIIARESTVLEITGEAWDNVSPAAPSTTTVGHIDARLSGTLHGSTPILAVHGAVVDEATGAAKEGFSVAVKNLSTDATLSALSGCDNPAGGYSVTFVDAISSRAARAGDVLEITVETLSSFIRVRSMRYIVLTDDIKASQIRLPDLIAYESPTDTKLLPNYPNPFNPETWIPFQLAEDAFVTLTIYDMAGQVVRTIEVRHQPADVYESKNKAICWDGRNELGERVASGLYFYSLTANDFTATRKMLILK